MTGWSQSGFLLTDQAALWPSGGVILGEAVELWPLLSNRIKKNKTVIIHISGSDLVERKHAPSHVPWNNLHFSKTKIWTKKKKKNPAIFLSQTFRLN